jgi:antitoxin component of MazEF toxin-antitoxin module
MGGEVVLEASGMRTVKVRRVGNSNVVSLPRELESLGFAAGAAVAVVPTRTGEIVLIPAERLDGYVDDLGARIVEENHAALKASTVQSREPVGSLAQM